MAASSCGMAMLAGDAGGMGRHISMLAAALESIEGRSEMLATRLASAQAEAAVYKAR